MALRPRRDFRFHGNEGPAPFLSRDFGGRGAPVGDGSGGVLHELPRFGRDVASHRSGATSDIIAKLSAFLSGMSGDGSGAPSGIVRYLRSAMRKDSRAGFQCIIATVRGAFDERQEHRTQTYQREFAPVARVRHDCIIGEDLAETVSDLVSADERFFGRRRRIDGLASQRDQDMELALVHMRFHLQS